MRHLFLGYLLEALEAEEIQELECWLAQDARLHQQLDILRRSLEPLAVDRQPITAPPGLAQRTCVTLREVLVRHKLGMPPAGDAETPPDE